MTDLPDQPKPTPGDAIHLESITKSQASQLASRVYRRLNREGRWTAVAQIKEDMQAAARAKGMTSPASQYWAYAELDKLFPPLGDNEIADEFGQPIPKPPEPTPASTPENETPARESGIQGLRDIPADWPELPNNASMQAEMSWVQSQRLIVVEETSSGRTIVHLSDAKSPAPSWAALSWLETSIRNYSKFVDVCTKTLNQQSDDTNVVKRERKSIGEVRAILSQMDDG